MLIRPARPEDIEEVLAIWSESAAEPTSADNAASLGLLLRHDPGSLLVAELDGHLVGTVISGWDGWRGSIYRLAVRPHHRRQGLARQLLSAAENRLSGLGAKRMQAIVVASDQRATGFWGIGLGGTDRSPALRNRMTDLAHRLSGFNRLEGRFVS